METKSAPVRPLLKWVGGKTQLLSELAQAFPNSVNNYFEPFVGGGAVFFHFGFEKSQISDVNPKLVNFYRQTADNPYQVLDELQKLTNLFGQEQSENRNVYYRLRSEFNDRFEENEASAALFLVINKTCFNGLYRVNSSGKFNVPFNNFRKIPNFVDLENFLKASERLRTARIRLADYKVATEGAIEGDFVYFDPPYVPLSISASFTSYAAEGFNEKQQLELLDWSVSLREKGVRVLLSNSYSPWVKEKYTAAGFSVETVRAKRNVAANNASREQVLEAIIRGY